MKTVFLKSLLSLTLLFICTSAFAYDLLKDPDNKLLSIPTGDQTYTYLYEPQNNISTIKLSGKRATFVWMLKSNALIDLRQTPRLHFMIKANFPLFAIFRFGNSRQQFSTHDLVPISSSRNQEGDYYTLKPDNWVEYSVDVSKAVSSTNPVFYEVQSIRMEINSERTGNFDNQIVELKNLEITPPDRQCTLAPNLQPLTEGTEAPIANPGEVSFFECADPNPMPEAAINNGKKYVLFFKWPGEMGKMLSATTPRADEMSSTERMSRQATPGETRNLAFAVRSKRFAINKMNVEATDLINQNDKTQKISADNVKINRVRYLYQKFRVRGVDGYTLKPAILEPLKDEPLRPNFTRPIWVSLHIPEGTNPGLYEGNLKLNVDGDITDIPVSITVAPFTLAPLDKPFGIFLTTRQAMRFKPLVRDNNGEGNILDDNLVFRWMKDIRDHGLNGIIFFTGIPNLVALPNRTKQFVLETGKFLKNLDIMDDEELLQQFEKAGFPKDVPFLFSPYVNWYEALSSAFAEQLKPGINMIHAHGWNKIIARQFDEPNNHFRGGEKDYTLNNLKKSFQAMRNSGLDTLAESDSTFQTVIGRGTDGKPLISYMGGYTSLLTPDAAARQHELGGKVMPTIQFIGRSENLLEDRGMKGVWIWRNRFDGMYGYSYYEPNATLGDIDDIEGEHAMGVIAMVGGEIRPTLMWEIDREAINDYRYLLTLEKMIATDPEAPWAKEASTYLDSLKEKFSEFAMDYSHTPPTETDYEEMRQNISGFVAKGIAASITSPPGSEPQTPPAENSFEGGGCGCTVCR